MRLFYKLWPSLNENPQGDHAPNGKHWLYFIRLKSVRYLLQSAAISIAAYLGVAVMVTYYFRIITPVVIAANLIVVPLASLIIFLGMGLLAAGTLFPFAAFAFANCIIASLNLMIVIVFLFARIPGAYFQVKDLSLWAVLLYYGLILIIISFHSSRLREPSLQPKIFP
jgi:hypothetical protein